MWWDSNPQPHGYQSSALTTRPQSPTTKIGSIMLILFKKLKKSTFDKWNVWWWNSFGIYQLGVRNALEGRYSKFFLENLILDTLYEFEKRLEMKKKIRFVRLRSGQSQKALGRLKLLFTYLLVLKTFFFIHQPFF